MIRNLFAIAIASLAFTSCETRSDVEIANEENILILGNSNEPKGLDPHLVSGVLESNILRSLFEGLCVGSPDKDGVSLPGAAKRWDPNEDASVWTFYLNPDGKWSDGVPVTAEDFVFSYKRMLSPSPNWPAKYCEMLYAIKNAEAYNRNHFGNLLCGNDPNFPTSWDVLQEANFEGNAKIKLSSFADKDFKKLEERDAKKFAPYLNEDETIDLKKLAAEKIDLAELSDPEKRVFLNITGIDKLNKEQLTFLKSKTDLMEWTDKVPEESRQLVLDRLIAHHEADKPNLWDKAQVGVEAIDDFTLRLTLRGPIPFLPEITKHFTWFPVPKHVVLRYGKINTAFESEWTRPGNLVSNGPFKLKTWVTNHVLEVERNPHYWDNKTVSLDGIRFLPINNYYTETRMYGDDQIHVTYTVPSELIPLAKEKYPDQLRQEPYVGVRFLRANTLKEKLSDPKVRRAFALAIDQKAICEKILQGGQVPADGIVPRFGDYNPPGIIEFDPVEAKRLLDESGFSNEGPELKLLTTNSDSGLREAEALQAMWKEHLGIKVRIEQREWGTYLEKQYSSDFDLVVAGWIGDFLDPTTFLELWVEGGGNNNTGWSSQKFEDLLQKAENTAEPAQRMAILAEAEKEVLVETPVFPIYYYTTNYLIRPEVKNWNPILLNKHPYKFLRLETK